MFNQTVIQVTPSNQVMFNHTFSNHPVGRFEKDGNITIVEAYPSQRPADWVMPKQMTVGFDGRDGTFSSMFYKNGDENRIEKLAKSPIWASSAMIKAEDALESFVADQRAKTGRASMGWISTESVAKLDELLGNFAMAIEAEYRNTVVRVSYAGKYVSPMGTFDKEGYLTSLGIIA